MAVQGRLLAQSLAAGLAFCVIGSAPAAAATIVAATCSSGHVQNAIDAAMSGDTVRIPAGTCTWTSGVTVSGKGIRIEGNGAGRQDSESSTPVTIGGGVKTFTTQSGLSFRPGEIVRAAYKATRHVYMEGTVVSYGGTTLTLNITSVAGSGTRSAWTFITQPSGRTILTHSIPNEGDMFSITEDRSHSTERTGIYFVRGAQNGTGATMVQVYGAPGGRPFLMHDTRVTDYIPAFAVRMDTNKGVFWNTAWECVTEWNQWQGGNNACTAIGFKALNAPESWRTASTMGRADLTGTSNVYVEDSYFIGQVGNYAVDFDDNSRVVMRHNTFDNAGIGSHGMETSPYGVRHYEVYDNRFVFDDLGLETANLNAWLYLRGGTGVITGNTFPNIYSSTWGDKTEAQLFIFGLRRAAQFQNCWGTSTPGGYPAPNQFGWGVTVLGLRILEPLYIWSNQGSLAIGAGNYAPNQCGAGAPDISAYIQRGREYVDNGTPKPLWSRFAYPHPLRTGNTGGVHEGPEAPTPPDGIYFITGG